MLIGALFVKEREVEATAASASLDVGTISIAIHSASSVNFCFYGIRASATGTLEFEVGLSLPGVECGSAIFVAAVVRVDLLVELDGAIWVSCFVGVGKFLGVVQELLELFAVLVFEVGHIFSFDTFSVLKES